MSLFLQRSRDEPPESDRGNAKRQCNNNISGNESSSGISSTDISTSPPQHLLEVHGSFSALLSSNTSSITSSLSPRLLLNFNEINSNQLFVNPRGTSSSSANSAGLGNTHQGTSISTSEGGNTRHGSSISQTTYPTAVQEDHAQAAALNLTENQFLLACAELLILNVPQPPNMKVIGILGEGGFGKVYEVELDIQDVNDITLVIPNRAAFKCVYHESSITTPTNFRATLSMSNNDDNITKMIANQKCDLEKISKLGKQIDALVRETRKLVEIGSHPNIVKYHYVAMDSLFPIVPLPNVGFIMEKAYYGSLYHVLNSFHKVQSMEELGILRKTSIKDVGIERALQVTSTEWIPISLCFSWLKQLASALKHVHSSNNQHKDLKPQNILIRENLTIALSDFGATANNMSFNSNVGGNSKVYSLIYGSPERLCGTNPSGPISDMYGYGVVAFTLLTQEYPNQGMRSPAQMRERYSRYLMSKINNIAHGCEKELLMDLFQRVILTTACCLSETDTINDGDLSFLPFPVNKVPRHSSAMIMTTLNELEIKFKDATSVTDADEKYFTSICQELQSTPL